MNEARSGDIVRVSLGSIYHYGIFVSEDEVIQFGLPPTFDRKAEEVEVLASPVEDFLAGGFLEVGICEGREKKRRKSPKETVNSARARLGERGYDILNNNCEHFANECAFGEKFSSMADDFLKKTGVIPSVFVYAVRFPFEVKDKKIIPPSRAKEIESCSDEKVRLQKFYSWKLLDKALSLSLGLKMKKLDISRTASGKWGCSKCFFSLSHSGNFVAVAVSEAPVGIDIERRDEGRFNAALAEKIVTDREQADLSPKTVNCLWTKKEAIFKLSGDGAFIPENIETADYNTVTRELTDGNESYFLSVATKGEAKVEFRALGKI